MISIVRKKISLVTQGKIQNSLSELKKMKKSKGTTMGAAFLMAASAVGPGFLIQTSFFTSRYKSDFIFAIILSTIVALIVQMNLWRIIGVSGMRGQDIANRVAPGLGYLVALLISLGGLAFNIGNIAGAALGFNILMGIEPSIGAVIAGGLCSLIFIARDSGAVMENFTKVLAIVLVTLVGYTLFKINPPASVILHKNLNPENFRNLIFPMMTIIGGTIGGYISFSGGHRLIETELTGKNNLKKIDGSACIGVLLSTFIRLMLFFAVLGIISKMGDLHSINPEASDLRHVSGIFGYKIFGVILLLASITSIVGSAYTSVSFIKTLFPVVEKNEKFSMIFFTAFSALMMALMGNPVVLLLVAGTFNGIILPVVLAIILLASKNKTVIGENYKHSEILTLLGFIVVMVLWLGGMESLDKIIAYFL
ncbi:NRAMP family divalent metal transporter [uncultured Ilyobacter sp.]|jgi:Mn2+/Fe2+ NRAMP family transporter|uniref:NRAMP family divalent metal transporter n=1 Tax=uncultured Ilyobacter sp. TaxID=544433 RepID=UPI0029C093C9|nr:NRAMP family divalent metal transporter [uncultured Ilyobacter sp.]